MNKSLFIIASMALGTTAIAQDMPPAGAPMQGSPPYTNTPAPASPSTPDSATPAPGGTMTPDGSAPPPMSSPTPADSSMATAVPADTSSYPKCSRTVTDKCVQTGGAGRHARKPR